MKWNRTTSQIGHSFFSQLQFSGCCESLSQYSSLIHPHHSSHLLQTSSQEKDPQWTLWPVRVPRQYGLLGLQLHLSLWFLLLHWVPPSLWLCHHAYSHWLCLGLLSPQLHLKSICSALALWSSNFRSPASLTLPLSSISLAPPWTAQLNAPLWTFIPPALSGNPTPPFCHGLTCCLLCGLLLRFHSGLFLCFFLLHWDFHLKSLFLHKSMTHSTVKN